VKPGTTGGTASRRRTRPGRSGRIDSRDREVSQAANSHLTGSPRRANRGRGSNTGDSHSRDSHSRDSHSDSSQGNSSQGNSSHSSASHSGDLDSRDGDRTGMVEA
jgi:hypothetical protein